MTTPADAAPEAARPEARPGAEAPGAATPEDRMPEAAVIVPHHDDRERLARGLAALARDPDLPRVEVVVVDNASPVDLGAVMAAHPFARLVVEPRRGAAAARNRGVVETRAPLLFFLDCDCVPAPGWIAAGFAALAGEGAPDAVGGRVEVFHEAEGVGPRSGAQAFEAVFAFDNRAYVERKGFSVTANLVTRRAVFEDVGPFRPGLSEDLDWCARARARGWRLGYDERLRVAHPSRADWPALERKWRRLTEETWGLGAGDARARARWAARALLMPASVVAHLPRVLRHPGLSGAERARAAATLARLRLRRAAWMLRQAAGGRL